MNAPYCPRVLVDTTNLSREEWLEWRRCGIGGSDAAAILGISPFRTARDLYYDKLGIAVDVDESNWVSLEMGNLLEPLVAQIFAKKTGLKVQKWKAMFQHPMYPWMLADLDYVTVLPDGKKAILEIKTTNYNAKDRWWYNGQEIVPVYYESQGRHYMAVMNIDRVYFCCLFGNTEDEAIIRHIDRDMDYEAELVMLEEIFWKENVLAKVPPPYTEDGDLILESLRRQYGPSDKEAPVMEMTMNQAALVKRYMELRQQAEQMNSETRNTEKEMKRVKALIIESLGNSRTARFEDAGTAYTVSYNPIRKTGITKENLERMKEVYICYALTGRTFAATLGANNTAGLDVLFSTLKANGTQEIIEAEDMDKYRNEAVNMGASKVYLTARSNGISCRRLTWNPNYKGFDDWQLAIRRKQIEQSKVRKMTFKEQYLSGLCDIDHIEACTAEWRTLPDDGPGGLREYLGLSEREYNVFLQTDISISFEALLNSQRRSVGFRIYQLDLEGGKTVPYAFCGLAKLKELGYRQPRASDYALVHEDMLFCPLEQSIDETLERIFNRFNDTLPDDYSGRSISASDVIEIFCDGERKYFYREATGFAEVQFSPMMVNKIRNYTDEHKSLQKIFPLNARYDTI